MSERRFNFSSGPATLPDQVLRAAQAAIWDLDGSGIGILEHSHRGPQFAAVISRAESLTRQLAQIPDDYAVLFVTGTASAHFHMVPMNFLSAGHTADYCHTGVWSGKAIDEARRQGAVHLACSSEASRFTHIPARCQWSPSAAYVHFTSNNTIHGTQWSAPPSPPSGVPIVCDASSDLFSRPIDVGRYDLIYAGAQKNLGPSGITLVIARRSFIAAGRRDVPPLLRYQTYADEHSLYNTPNTFGIYVLAEVLQWIVECGGLAAMHTRNLAKAKLLYDFLDRSRVFSGHAAPDSRSLMNVTFRATTPAVEEALLADAESHGMSGLRGHRSVGGLRASIYNAFPLRGVERLVERLEHFERTHAGSGA